MYGAKCACLFAIQKTIDELKKIFTNENEYVDE